MFDKGRYKVVTRHWGCDLISTGSSCPFLLRPNILSAAPSDPVMQLLPEEEQERENGDLLASIGNVATDVARRVLRKHKGDMEKAADAILAGDTGEEEEEIWTNPGRNTPDPSWNPVAVAKAPTPRVTPVPSTSVIDLTKEDHGGEYTRAIQMSMDTSQTGVRFGPSERPPNPDWQMVPSNVQVASGGAVTQEDQTLKDAIQASLNEFTDESDVFPIKETVREGGRPVALRSELAAHAYIALVLQALYFVPQVTENVAKLRLPDIDENLPLDHTARVIWNLVELFANMDLVQLSAIVDVNVLPSFATPPGDGNNDSLAEASAKIVSNVGHAIEDHLKAQGEDVVHLFSFTSCQIELNGRMPRRVSRNYGPGTVVHFEFGGDDSGPNDLLSCLSSVLSRFREGGSSHDVIIKPSELVGFQLKRLPSQSTATPKTTPDAFVFPKWIYLDQFLFHNLELANNKREMEREINAEIRELTAHRETLTHFNKRDTIKDLRSTIHYYEHVANPGDDPVRKQTIERTAAHLKDILIMITSKVEDIDHKVDKLQAECATLFDCPELQQHRYDLRAVLMHTGLPGRKQMYSYVQDSDGVWWKTVDYEVTEVPEETVLTDPTGLHLSAGPYLLLYSKHLSEDELHAPVVWPKIFTDPVEENNKKFLSILSPELVGKAKIPTLVTPPPPPPPPLRRASTLSPPRERTWDGQPISRQKSRTMDMGLD